jgi:hypothetical protein
MTSPKGVGIDSAEAGEGISTHSTFQVPQIFLFLESDRTRFVIQTFFTVLSR